MKKLGLSERVGAMVHTTGEDYGVKVSVGGANSTTSTDKTVNVADAEVLMGMGMHEDDAISTVVTSAAHEGGHIKYSNLKDIRENVKRASKSGIDAESYATLTNIAEDIRIDRAVGKERRGYVDMNSDNLKRATQMFKDAPDTFEKKDLFFKAACLKAYGVDMRDSGGKKWERALDWDKVNTVADAMRKIGEHAKTTDEVFKHVFDYCKKTGMFSGEEPESPPSMSGGSASKSPDSSDKTGKPMPGMDGVGREDGKEKDKDSEEGDSGSSSDTEGGSHGSSGGDSESGTDKDAVERAIKALEKEFSGKGESEKKFMDDSTRKKFEEVKSKKRSRAADYSDLSRIEEEWRKNLLRCRKYRDLWSAEKRKEVESRLCVGLHAGADVLYCVRDGGSYDRFSGKDLLPEARKLGARLSQALAAEADDMGETAKSGGKLIANKVWKPQYTGNNDVFYKKTYTEEGGYCVDLLIDASGSQHSREASIRAQLYVIAQACSIAKLPCRVTEFWTERGTTIVKRLRDYDDPESMNAVAAGMFSIGSENRDALAIGIAYEELKLRPESRKIFLILSDGAPVDANDCDKITAAGGTSPLYGSRIEVRSDVARVIRDIRNDGVALMGVYVGDHATLQFEKEMYGTDFAFIKGMELFSETVMKYLLKHIQRLG